MKKVYLVAKEEKFSRQLPLDEFQLVLLDSPGQAESIFVLGGDGTMLSAIRNYFHFKIPFFGFNFGHLGFLMNKPTQEVLAEIINGNFQLITQRLLIGEMFDRRFDQKEEKSNFFLLAFNDFYFERANSKTIRIRVSIDDKIQFDPLIGDGIIVCTPAGSTAYNASAGGKILPLETSALVLTGICPAVHHHWRSSILPPETTILLEAIDIKERPVRLIADGIQIKGGSKIQIRYSDVKVQLGFAQSQNFREKVLRLQLGKIL